MACGFPTRGDGTGRSRHRPRILVLGIGNLLLRDDGIGVHALRALQKAPPPGILTAEAGTNILSAAHLLERADHVIALDALMAGGKPGSVYVLPLDAIRHERVSGSLHELDLVFHIHSMKTRKPGVVVVAVEPELIEIGMELSETVAAVLPEVVKTALGLIQECQDAARRKHKQPRPSAGGC